MEFRLFLCIGRLMHKTRLRSEACLLLKWQDRIMDERAVVASCASRPELADLVLEGAGWIRAVLAKLALLVIFVLIHVEKHKQLKRV